MTWLGPAPATPAGDALLAGDRADLGYVMNLSRVWAHRPDLNDQLFALVGTAAAELTVRQRGILVCASAATLGDSYCSLAWGNRLAAVADADLAAAVLRGDDDALVPAERALARWARQVTGDPSATTGADVDLLRKAGWDDAQILAITLFVALRLAFSTVNGALGAAPDPELAAAAPAEVRAAVSYGRPVG